jgi:tripartite-type tricarboxylate transporter receptor subunit TctC
MKYSVRALACALCVLLVAAAARAESWPTRPVRMIVPFPAGGTLDILARQIGQEISKSTGQPFVVENKPGGGTVIGVDAAAKSTDGHTFVMVANSFAVNATLVKSLPYDTLKDLQPVGLVARTANVLAAHPSLPAGNLQELIAYAKRNPGKLSYASFGNGTTAHFAGEMLKLMAGIDMLHVPYKGQLPGMNDVIAGRVDLMFGNLPEFLPQIHAGKLKAYGTTYLKRAKLAPEIPTIAEQGFPQFTTDSWYGILAPASASAEAVTRLNAEVNAALAVPAISESLEKRGLDRLGGSPEQFGAFMRQEIAKYAKIVADANIKID